MLTRISVPTSILVLVLVTDLGRAQNHSGTYQLNAPVKGGTAFGCNNVDFSQIQIVDTNPSVVVTPVPFQPSPGTMTGSWTSATRFVVTNQINGACIEDWTLTVDFAAPGSPTVTTAQFDIVYSGNIMVCMCSDWARTRNGTCITPITTYCTAGVSFNGCTASLSATGTASASAPTGFTVQAVGAEGAKNGIFFYSSNGRQASSWGNGTSYQCVVPPVKRGGLLAGSGTTGLCDGTFGQDLNARWCPACPKPAHNPGGGATMQVQLWYRDPTSTSNQTTSLSNAIEFAVCN